MFHLPAGQLSDRLPDPIDGAADTVVLDLVVQVATNVASEG
jgi:hypothetical protein